jgi:hypothetical protein
MPEAPTTRSARLITGLEQPNSDARAELIPLLLCQQLLPEAAHACRVTDSVIVSFPPTALIESGRLAASCYIGSRNMCCLESRQAPVNCRGMYAAQLTETRTLRSESAECDKTHWLRGAPR